ncbi:hypothetical protein CHARACLAT_030019, partial [Characodon lateralis]|nr:hypothetical protein [Characodon lateralis]
MLNSYSKCIAGLFVFLCLQHSGIKHLEGEVFRSYFSYPGHRKSNIIITNRRVFCVKEMDLLGHLTTDWECLFENFYRSPTVTGSELKIYCKEIHKLKLQKTQEPVRMIQFKDADTAK